MKCVRYTLRKMQAIKRFFLPVDEILSFKASNNFVIERYFNATHFNAFENDIMKLWFDHSYAVIANSMIVEMIYYDYSKQIKKYEPVEYVEIVNVPLPKEGILKHNEFYIPIKIKVDTKVLWKITFKIKPKIESDLHISVKGCFFATS